MSQYVTDSSRKKWMILSPQRTERPDNFQKQAVPKAKVCPFCVGNESMSEEVYRIGGNDISDWKVRVVSNKYPITDSHEIVIHSQDDKKDFQTLEIPQIADIIQAYKHRFNFYKDQGVPVIFCNQGEHAGASLTHPHSQIVVVSPDIQIDLLLIESLTNKVDENESFISYCPEFSEWPFEVWLQPKKTEQYFGDITETEIQHLAGILKLSIQNLRKVYDERTFSMLPFAYNFYIYPKKNWYLRIIPRFIHRGGFELATGIQVNIVDPGSAANTLRDEEKIEGVLGKLKKYES